jgi:uncharacterized membrane protein
LVEREPAGWTRRFGKRKVISLSALAYRTTASLASTPGRVDPVPGGLHATHQPLGHLAPLVHIKLESEWPACSTGNVFQPARGLSRSDHERPDFFGGLSGGAVGPIAPPSRGLSLLSLSTMPRAMHRCSTLLLRWQHNVSAEETMPKTRFEAFSDGVFAVAITLLVFNIDVPPLEHGHLWVALLHEWPSFAAYAVSFLIIGIIWVNHHGIFQQIARVDRPILFLNIFLLMVVVFIPFPSRMLSLYLQAGPDSHVAAAIYSFTMVLMSIGFILLWGYAVYHPDLLTESVKPGLARSTLPRFGIGVLVYLVTVGVAFISAAWCLMLHALIALYYVFDRVSTGGSTRTADGSSITRDQQV